MTLATVSICSQQHADVWKLTSRLLPSCVEADAYQLVVPKRELHFFRNITESQFDLVAQEDVGRDFEALLRRSLQQAGNESRFGWYWQQFLKIESLIRMNADTLAIWDADCVPVSKVNLVDGEGRPSYMKAGEFNAEYFNVIQKLTGSVREVESSFVIPGFPLRRQWVHDWVATVETRHPGLRWYEAICSVVDFRERSGFSETETLGTWISNTYRNDWSQSFYNWERLGTSRFGFPSKWSASELVRLGRRKNLDIISFENWDPPGLRGSWRRVKRRLRDGE